jgi:hypothetical protein
MTACSLLVQRHLEFLKERFDCVQEADGLTVITTPYQFPDNRHIDVFLKEADDGRLLASDLGEAMRYTAAMCGTDLLRSQGDLVKEIVMQHGLQISKGGVIGTVTTYPESGETIFHMAQAIMEIAALIHTTRSSKMLTFRDTFRTFLDKAEVRYEPRYRVKGQADEWEADFYVPIGQGKIIQVLGGSHLKSQGYETYTMFDDLQAAEHPAGRFVVLERDPGERMTRLLTSKGEILSMHTPDITALLKRA